MFCTTGQADITPDLHPPGQGMGTKSRLISGDKIKTDFCIHSVLINFKRLIKLQFGH